MSENGTLLKLAALHGVEASYTDVQGQERKAGVHSLVAVLKALGVSLEGPEDAADALRDSLLQRWSRLCEPVAVAWEGRPAAIKLRAPIKLPEVRLECSLESEEGESLQWERPLSSLPLIREVAVEGSQYGVRRLELPTLPVGYHSLTVRVGGIICNTLVISAPRRLYGDLGGMGSKVWGVFIPLYALNSDRSWGAGDFSDLDRLLCWIDQKGGEIAGTLPLLAAYLEEPLLDPSPYSPVSRLFWNEFYLDVRGLEEFKECPEAVSLFNSALFNKELASLRESRLVDYRRAMALKRSVLELCCKKLFNDKGPRRELLGQWADQNTEAKWYARFRAAVEKKRFGWRTWPEAMRNGLIKSGDFDPAVERYHLYVQWAASEQLGELAGRARGRGQGLYLDLPLGVHSDGYDTWRERKIFVFGASTGAPPDPLCAGGQDWELPPLHPERIREQGYRYYINCIRNHLQYAGILRLDHVMGLHRLFWLPRSMPASEGVYVRYRAEEFYAILSIESHRYRSAIVGEDLGVVPGYVRRAMSRHGLLGMYVLPFEYTGESGRVLRKVPSSVLSCLNTHDMRPFTSFWEEMRESGGYSILTTFLKKKGWLSRATEDAGKALRGCLAHLAASDSRAVLVNLEDLWLEKEPQNVPGTIDQYPNWRRKAGYTFERFSAPGEIGNILKKIDLIRKSRRRLRLPGGIKKNDK
ncbi:MAG: 4-alpha-glucanotransferase [Peptococcaceae bacterium BICA1-7]|nr:MAG: 4-alpha-glucanotransferase [Peptococcaceae bacterium BICA1-7]HBV97672.1 4-alpha-glucanotransferase [Desulfotomaculum sp.]